LTAAALRRWLALGLWALAAQAFGDGAPPSWRTTLEQDLHGPAVTWTGIIVKAIRDEDYTCFLLQRAFGGEPFAACNPGAFDGVLFAPGQALKVKGNLGEARERKLGVETFNGPLIAAAFVERTTLVYPAPSWWHDDPFHPWGYRPRWGIHYWP